MGLEDMDVAEAVGCVEDSVKKAEELYGMPVDEAVQELGQYEQAVLEAVVRFERALGEMERGARYHPGVDPSSTARYEE